METLKIKKIVEDLEDINYTRDGDAALDLRASGKWIINLDENKEEIINNEYEIKPNERILIKTGIKIEIPKWHYGQIKDRSGLAMKYGLNIMGGVIDENYRDEIGVIMINHGSKSYKLIKNERIAQMIIKKYTKVNVEYVDELNKTAREGGFGSSGTI